MNYSPPPLQTRRADPVIDLHPLEWIPQVLGFLWRRWLLIAASAVVFSALAIGYGSSARPSYSAYATVLIDTRKLHPFRQQSLVGESGSDNVFIETQVQIMVSEDVTREVVRRLRLVDNPVFTGEALPPLTGVAGAVASLAALPRQVRQWLAPAPALGESTEAQPDDREEGAAAQLADMVRTRRVPSTTLVSVQVNAPHPELAAEIANTLIEAYIDTQLAAISSGARRASTWLEERMRLLRESVLEADRDVQQYRIEKNIVGTDRGLISEQQLQELSTQLMQSRSRVTEAEARQSRIMAAVQSDLQDSTVAELLQSPVVSQLRTQLLDLSRREAEFTQRFGANHNSTVQLRNEIAELRRSINSELRRILDSARGDLQGARTNEAQIMRQMDDLVQQWAVTNADRITLRTLEGQANSYRQIFENFLVRYTQVVQDESYPVSDARVVSSATPPNAPASPRKIVILALGLMGGIGFGFFLAMLLEAADKRLRTPLQARLATGIDCLGIVPLLRRGLLGNDVAALMREVLKRPNSRFSEAVLGLQTRVVQHLQRLRNAQVVMCVGTSPDAGCSTVAAALALCLAQSGRRTVLVDLDLRAATTSAALAPTAEFGFLDVFEGHASLSEALLLDQQTGLKLLAAGKLSTARHAAAVLGSERAQTILAQLRADHDVVVVDLPPMGPLADAHAAVASADAVLLVLEWGGPGQHEIAELLSRFDPGNASLLGCVLNKVDTKKALRYVTPGGGAYLKAV